MPPPANIVRVYLGATYRDMRAEREFLHTHVFPAIKAWFKDKGTTLEFVDLGYRNTEADAEGFDKIKQVFDVMERCRPYFIFLLGERYGPGVEKIAPDAMAAYPWLRKVKKGMSRLHLEIMHALLNDPSKADKCFFYKRNPDILQHVPEDERALYLPDTPQESARLKYVEDKIRAAGRKVAKYGCIWNALTQQISELEELGKAITHDFHLSLADLTCGSRADDVIDIGSPFGYSATVSRGIIDSLRVETTRRESVGALERVLSEEPVVDENVQFTVFRPKIVVPEQWYKLLAFAHLSKNRPDAPKEEPAPIKQVQAIAEAKLGPQMQQYEKRTDDATRAVPRQGELTFVPWMPDVEFKPAKRTFVWEDSVHEESFQMKASARLDGKVARGKLSVYLGAILIADVTLVVEVNRQHVAPAAAADKPEERVEATPYRKIFASYSHKDLDIVEQFEAYAKTLGDEYLRDWKHLRAGEKWNDKLMSLIDQADVFQLFWSHNSMHSAFVRQEWEYALAKKKDHFVRPTYWQQPMPRSANPMLPPPGLAELHFESIGTALMPGAAGGELTHPFSYFGLPVTLDRAAIKSAVEAKLSAELKFKNKEPQRLHKFYQCAKLIASWDPESMAGSFEIDGRKVEALAERSLKQLEPLVRMRVTSGNMIGGEQLDEIAELARAAFQIDPALARQHAEKLAGQWGVRVDGAKSVKPTTKVEKPVGDVAPAAPPAPADSEFDLMLDDAGSEPAVAASKPAPADESGFERSLDDDLGGVDDIFAEDAEAPAVEAEAAVDWTEPAKKSKKPTMGDEDEPVAPKWSAPRSSPAFAMPAMASMPSAPRKRASALPLRWLILGVAVLVLLGGGAVAAYFLGLLNMITGL